MHVWLKKIRIKNKTIEKVDGVLHFTFNIDIMAKIVSDKQETKLNKLEVVINGN